MSPNVYIPYEVADGITLATLVGHYNTIKNEYDDYLAGEKYLHKDDVSNHAKLITSFECMIKYFGG